MNPKVLQEILGHSTITMTMDLYSHVMPEFKKSAMAKMDYLYKREDKNKVTPPDEKHPTRTRKEKAKTKENGKEFNI
jgi:hypothetical protein